MNLPRILFYYTIFRLNFTCISSFETGNENSRALIEAIIGSIEAQDLLSLEDISSIRQRRLAAKANFKAALQGNDLAEIKEAHAALEATDQQAQIARLALAANLRKKIASQIRNALLDLHNRKISPTQLQNKIIEIVDMMIENAAKIG